MKIQSYIDNVWNWASTSGLKILVIFVLLFIALKLKKLFVRRIMESMKTVAGDREMQKRTETLSSIINYASSLVIIAVASMMVLREFGIEIGPILAAAGVLGLAVGFGAQNLVQDVISGFFILLEDQIRVGDVVDIAGKGGLVEKVTLRMIVLRDLAGNVHYIRNGQIEVITNMTKEYSRFVFEIGIAYREDVDQVIEVVKGIDEDMRNDPVYRDDILEPLEVLGLDKFGDSAIVIKARTKTKPIQQWKIAREFNRRMKKKFDELGIEIPFPHVTIYLGQDKNGSAPPLRVSVER